MNNLNVFALQVTLTFVSFILLAKYYIWPKVKNMDLYDALSALVATHMFRHLGLVFFVIPQIVSATVPQDWSSKVAYGDLASVVLAILAFIALKKRSSVALGLVWLFNIVGLLDLLSAYATGYMKQAWSLEVGSAWVIPTFIVPALITTHVMMLMLLMKSRNTSSANI
jgi:hypothetical protein